MSAATPVSPPLPVPPPAPSAPPTAEQQAAYAREIGRVTANIGHLLASEKSATVVLSALASLFIGVARSTGAPKAAIMAGLSEAYDTAAKLVPNPMAPPGVPAAPATP